MHTAWLLPEVQKLPVILKLQTFQNCEAFKWHLSALRTENDHLLFMEHYQTAGQKGAGVF
jgi:hypothetical protein